MESFALLCVTSLAGQQLRVITEAFAIAGQRNPGLRLTVSAADAGAELFHAADLLICLADDPAAATAIRRAQALGVPVLAVAEGAGCELIEHGRSGFLTAADPLALADTIRWLMRRAPVRERLRAGGLLAAGSGLALPA